ncbi:MAG: hypothetical protein IPH69_06255 [Bacteroidales bacterium]|nr:hypothetical protein [Bacteroidales bacterium]
MALELNWTKCQGDVWCDFLKVNLDHQHFIDLSGVYIIWSDKITVKVGSGYIKERILMHRNDLKILEYPNLKVIWAKVDRNQMIGVERYLGELLNPKVTEKLPDVTPIEVNWPWK